MPLAHKTNPQTTTTSIPDSLKNQISNNFKKDDEFKSSVTSEPKAENPAPAAAKSKYADSVNLRLTSGKRNEFKKFFTECEISMNQGFEMAVDYILRETKAGRITVSKSGINKIGEM